MQVNLTTDELIAFLNGTLASQVADAVVAKLLPLFQVVQQEETQIMATIADIQAAVANETTVEQGVITLLGQLSQELQAAIAANDPAAMQAVVDQINANSANLAAAVQANTPAAPAGP
jgi:hypothetical protein